MNAVFEGNKAVGASVRRVEDPRYLEGRASYVDDLQSAGLLHLAFVRTSNAHAKVVDVDVTSALEVPGVVAAYTADDLAGLMKPILAESSLPGYNASFRPALATDRVRFVAAEHEGVWELPVLGEVAAPPAVLIRPDGHVAWAGDPTDPELPRALATWFGSGDSGS